MNGDEKQQHILTLRHSSQSSSTTSEGISDRLMVNQKEEHSSVDRWIDALCIFLNIASAVGVVATNKVIFSHYNFRFGTLLTTIHFTVTSLILLVLSHRGLFFQPKYQPISKILPLSLSFCGFVALTNLSLLHNSVGFYQMAKVLTTPCVALLQYVLHGQPIRLGVGMTLVVTCVGVMISTFTEINLNMVGLVIALSAVLITSLYQVAPISAVLLGATVPFFDSVQSILAFPYTAGLLWTIGLSALMAVMVNISTFLVIGRTSAITYNMVGHGKLALVLLCGYLFFDGHALNVGNLVGISMTFTGILTYSYLTIPNRSK